MSNTRLWQTNTPGETCDFTVVFGCDQAGYEKAVGLHSLSPDLSREDSLILRDTARS